MVTRYRVSMGDSWVVAVVRKSDNPQQLPAVMFTARKQDAGEWADRQAAQQAAAAVASIYGDRVRVRPFLRGVEQPT